jgi:hypothetical protein
MPQLIRYFPLPITSNLMFLISPLSFPFIMDIHIREINSLKWKFYFVTDVLLATVPETLGQCWAYSRYTINIY